MRIIVSKSLMPTRIPEVESKRQLEHYKFDGYRYGNPVLEGPSSDLDVEAAIHIARTGFGLEAYEYFFEIPDANVNDIVPTDISWADGVITWADTGMLIQGTSNSMRYWQSANNGMFNYMDVEFIREMGYAVYGIRAMQIRINEGEYSDTGDPEYTPIETIQFIKDNWNYGVYFDMLHAQIRMKEIFDAKGADESSRWAACTLEEQKIVTEWNLVSIQTAASLVAGLSPEGRQIKELGRLFRLYNLNAILSLQARFNDWFNYLMMMFNPAGRTKFDADWDWTLEDEYVKKYGRHFELSRTNLLLDWHDTVLATYTDTDFFGSIPATTIVANLRKVLTDKSYYI